MKAYYNNTQINLLRPSQSSSIHIDLDSLVRLFDLSTDEIDCIRDFAPYTCYMITDLVSDLDKMSRRKDRPNDHFLVFRWLESVSYGHNFITFPSLETLEIATSFYYTRVPKVTKASFRKYFEPILANNTSIGTYDADWGWGPTKRTYNPRVNKKAIEIKPVVLPINI